MNSDRSCPTCGTTLSEWLSKNRTGCANCYLVFRNEVSEYLRRSQGFSFAPINELLDEGDSMRTHLEVLLNEAIAKEEYEVAAKLRDQLSALKQLPSNV